VMQQACMLLHLCTEEEEEEEESPRLNKPWVPKPCSSASLTSKELSIMDLLPQSSQPSILSSSLGIFTAVN
jgi:hypothetical protein